MRGIGRMTLIQPPFVQLNSPYPALYYLKSFLEKRGLYVTVLDHSIGLFERVFSRSGLARIFEDASALTPASTAMPAGQSKRMIPVIERFLSEKDLWLASIDRLIAFLRGRDPEWGHFLALANGSLPGGPRVDVYLAEKDGNIRADETKLVATKMLADLADFITCTLDSGFSLIRYSPTMEASLNSGFRDFAAVQKSLEVNVTDAGKSGAYIMDTFYRPMLSEEWDKLEKAEGGFTGPGDGIANGSAVPFLLGVTIPFPGCLIPALVCAESAKKHFGSAVRTVAGGGYVNTELRFCNTPEFFDYFDYVSFDRGYGSLVSILEQMGAGEGGGIYKTMYRFQETVIPPDIAPNGAAGNDVVNDKAALEDEAVRTIFPDYSAVDFGRYLYPVDDTNPMHRLWSDGHWLKAYLAQGCYWHSCAFCDVTLDYIRNFIPVDAAALFAHLKNQAEQTGVRGVHLCDEAAPVSSLLEFALLNREAELPLSFWGNIRFEKDFDPDTAAILAAGGLMGVSAGLEVATESGFRRLGKGINLEGSVRTCAAFKEAGILTHAYLIYGYWDEDEQEIIDSAEILRQLFAQGLLDSAFWHKFILTRHSRIYAEKQRGRHPGLEVLAEPAGEGELLFALNDLSFKGEQKYDKYTEGLDRLLGMWMAGETETPVTEAFPFVVKSPSIPPDLVAGLLDEYARDRDRAGSALPDTDKKTGVAEKVLFLGSIPRPRREGSSIVLRWRWRLIDEKLKTPGKAEAEKIAALLETASRRNGFDGAGFFSSLEEISGNAEAKRIWKHLRGTGLAVYRGRNA